MSRIEMGVSSLLTAAAKNGIIAQMISAEPAPVEADVIARLDESRKVCEVEPRTMTGELFLSWLIAGGD